MAAALTIALALLGRPVGADEPRPVAPNEVKKGGAAEDRTYTVRLDLVIPGLDARGCDVDVKPAHPGCRFQPLSKHVDSRGKASVVLNDVRCLNADRDCSVSITIHEPGRADRTVLRGLRLKAESTSAQLLTCYVTASPTDSVARSGQGATKKR
jgi:hypothetical protein